MLGLWKLRSNRAVLFLKLSFILLSQLSITFSHLIVNIDNPIYPILLTLPILFSGIAFSKEILKINSTSQALSANILGAMFGGFLEYNSMYFGFGSLYILAGVIYLLAMLTSKYNNVISL